MQADMHMLPPDFASALEVIGGGEHPWQVCPVPPPADLGEINEKHRALLTIMKHIKPPLEDDAQCRFFLGVLKWRLDKIPRRRLRTPAELKSWLLTLEMFKVVYEIIGLE
ncbi:MAG TPA: hypothetical protein VM223_04310, partial [Planctomycetota bacterium]|nr:hypothetical protein [Planctomycetota bacterium]